MIAVPDHTPTLPETMVAPVFVTVDPPRTAKFAADASGTLWANEHDADKRNTPKVFKSLALAQDRLSRALSACGSGNGLSFFNSSPYETASVVCVNFRLWGKHERRPEYPNSFTAASELAMHGKFD